MEQSEPRTVQCNGITLIQADCMDVLQGLPDNAFDLAIVDPPYGLHIDGQKQQVCKNPKHNRKYHANKGWDKLPPPKNILQNWNVCRKTKSFGVRIISCRTCTRQRKVGLCGSKVNKV